MKGPDSEFNNVKPLDWEMRKNGLYKKIGCSLDLMNLMMPDDADDA